MTSPIAAPAAVPARPATRPYTRIDWKQVAGLIAGGRTVDEAAAATGLAPDRIWRHLNRSLRFRFYIRQAAERQRLLAELHLAAAGCEAVLARSRDAASLDAAELQWLAAEAGLAGACDRRAAEQRDAGADLVQQLAATGNRPPSQKRHQAFAAEKADMDRYMAAARVELAAAEALWRAGTEAGPQRAGTDRNGPQRAGTVTNGQ